jgi:hypothetical protein
MTAKLLQAKPIRAGKNMTIANIGVVYAFVANSSISARGHILARSSESTQFVYSARKLRFHEAFFEIKSVCLADGKVSIKFSYFLNVFEFFLLCYCCLLKHVCVFIVLICIEFDSHSSASFRRLVALFPSCFSLIFWQ